MCFKEESLKTKMAFFFFLTNEQLLISFVSTLPFLFLALNSFKKLFIKEMIMYQLL